MKDMSRFWHLGFAIMIIVINCVKAEPKELENLRHRLDLMDLRLASDILVLRRELDTERSLRIELQSTVHQLQEQLQQQQQQLSAINHTMSLQESYLQQQKFGNSLAKRPEETDILKADVQNVNYENQIRRNVFVLQAFREEKQTRKQMESTVQNLKSKCEDLQSDLKTATDQVKELMQYKSLSEKSLTIIQSELQHVERKQNELNNSASNARNQMDAFIEGVSNQVCQLNPSFVDICQNYDINKSSCCLRKALESVHEILKVNGLKLSEFENQVNLRVSFSTSIRHTIENINPWDTIVFSNVLNNEGSAYNPTNGKFVAPVDGTYVFFSHILGASRRLETALKINEDIKLWLYSGDLMHLAPGSNMLIIRMYKGDSARMVKHGPWGERPFYIHHLWSTFSGFLLSAG
ncbi:hypothetical protein CHS0354_027906 [Potamilus streckersoni]|uniref:C1q domain-containing protein n=1 Tax=Potamilus streckersoni TaxID=2493646 RepID=A0AAE0W5S5_9BIVA|nr:hypothetical protein CHS0354_027906 [Potamilus streckersoni]